ncbi:glutathione S-transferase family protein [Natronospirillum sp.]|uniref:glutathione S-transferase family protein n=1 Tax=Natronospirillum sp. TaxID=2812955 RepID=UPI0025ED6BC9|nr:glutathione S-transferase family protein [Natronospirillum sp.]
MQLFGSYTSPYVRHCRIALSETGTEFTLTETDHAASAKQSPAQRVPFMEDGNVRLHDSASILKYVRERAGQAWMADVQQYDLFCLCNTALDATINVFLLERSGVDPQSNDYLKRQSGRIRTTVEALEALAAERGLQWNDGSIRLACFMDWAIYRQRFDFSAYPTLTQWLKEASARDEFKATAPPPQ